MTNELRLLLLKMRDKDQEVRARVRESIKKEGNFMSTDKKLGEEMDYIDFKHTQEMKKIVKEYGWPTVSLVGEEASRAAWLLVQHADNNVEFQEFCLNLICSALKDNDVNSIDYVYLYDRICINKNLPQLYGTQFMSENGKLVPRPIEDKNNLDKRRKKFGLEPFEEYKQFLKKHNEI